MPFMKKKDTGSPQPPADVQKIFVGRTNELYFFIEHILKPEEPAYNIISIHGDGGVGKSTLVTRFIEEMQASSYKSYCMAAIVNTRQATPASMMERFAEQLQLGGIFKSALSRYKDAVRKLQVEQETMQDAVLQHAPDLAGAVVEGVPFVGPLLREGAKLTMHRVLHEYRSTQARKDIERLEDPVGELTRAFATELNYLAETRIVVSGLANRRQRRIVLFFDTFEVLATEAAPWLLDHFLPLNISGNVVLVTAGRIPIERSIPEDPKLWLPYRDSNTIYSIGLNSFTGEETRIFLGQRGITDAAQIDRIWRLSRGLPLYLSLLTSDLQHEIDPTADVVDNFLRWIPESQAMKRRLVLDAALFSRPFNQDDFVAFAYIPELERPVLYRWLIKQPFVLGSAQDGRYSYHELAEDLFSRHLQQSSPNACYATRQALANYYRNGLERIQVQGGKEVYKTPEWISLTVALAQQLFLLPDGASHISAIEQILHAYNRTKQDEEVTRILREIAEERHYNQANADAMLSASIVLRYIESEPMSQDFVEAASALLAKVGASPTFASRQLARIYSLRGVAYRSLDENERAITDLSRAIELNPRYAWAWGNRGITYRMRKEYDLALQDFHAALELDDTMDWVYAGRGEVYRHLREYQRARADFDRAIALDPDYGQAYAGRGRVFSRLALYTEALADFDHALALEPGEDWLYAQRGEVYRKLKRYAPAIEDFTQAITLNPTYFWAYGSRGFIYFDLRDYDAALENYNRAIELDPTYSWCYMERGRLYHHLQAYGQAMADFNQAIELEADYARSYSHRGITYAALHQYQRALQDFDHAIALAPSYARTYGRRGAAYLGSGDIEKARTDFAKNYELAPGDSWAGWMYEWTSMCQERGDAQTAERLLSIAARQPQNYLACVCRAVAAWLHGEAEQALSQLQEASAMRPSKWDAHFWLGLVAGSLGRTESVASVKRALAYGMPIVMLAPLRWLEHENPAFYQEHVTSLF